MYLYNINKHFNKNKSFYIQDFTSKKNQGIINLKSNFVLKLANLGKFEKLTFNFFDSINLYLSVLSEQD